MAPNGSQWLPLTSSDFHHVSSRVAYSPTTTPQLKTERPVGGPAAELASIADKRVAEAEAKVSA